MSTVVGDDYDCKVKVPEIIHLPNHVLIIPDGNRRFATKNDISLKEAYELAANKVSKLIKWILDDLDIPQLTVYGLSYDNVNNRKYEDIKSIVQAIIYEFKKWVHDPLIRNKEIKIKVLGENEKLPPEFQLAKQNLEKATKSYTKKRLNILVGYSGRRELLSTFRKMQNKNIEDNGFLKNLWLDSQIDLIIRTAHDHRLSDCPLYQTSYAEIMFMEKRFPGITRNDIEEAMRSYSLREKRFGA